MSLKYLQEKWGVWFTLLDANGDGKLSKEDVELVVTRFNESFSITGREATEMKKKVHGVWDKYLLKNRFSSVSRKDFIDDLSSEYLADRDKCLKRLTECQGQLMTLIDYDGDGRISLEEYRNLHKLFDLHEEELIKTPFEMYREGEDMPFDVINGAWVDFIAGDDQENQGKLTKYLMSRPLK